MDEAIKSFFAERKSGWLKGKLKSTMMDEDKKRLEEECEEKFSLANWLPDAAKRAAQLFMATHPCKFSHPDAKPKEISSIIANAPEKADGFLRTGNVAEYRTPTLDVSGNAAAMDVYKFLLLKLKDDKTVIEHLEQGSDIIKDELCISTASFDEIQKNLLAIKQSGDTPVTSGKIKQVYFPCEGDYHLLSILTPSGLVFGLKNRINDMRFSEQTKEARELKKKNNYSEKGFDDLFNLSMIGYGGTKPQNISVFNSQHGGKAYLLPSLPPLLQKRTVRLPRSDFFKNTLWTGRFKNSFNSLHNLMCQDHNNLKIRKGRDNIICYIIDQVIDEMWAIRQYEAGWSQTKSYSSLPAYQKICLDAFYIQDRENSEEWLKRIVGDFSRWIVFAYKKVQGKQALSLGDDELLHIKNLIEQNREALL